MTTRPTRLRPRGALLSSGDGAAADLGTAAAAAAATTATAASAASAATALNTTAMIPPPEPYAFVSCATPIEVCY